MCSPYDTLPNPCENFHGIFTLRSRNYHCFITIIIYIIINIIIIIINMGNHLKDFDNVLFEDYDLAVLVTVKEPGIVNSTGNTSSLVG